MNDDPYADWDAAYALEALSAPEKREFEEHLDTCPFCRAGVDRLLPVAAALSASLRERDARRSAPLAELAESARRARRRRSTLMVMTAAAIALVLGSVGHALLDPVLSTITARSDSLPLTPVDESGVRADLTITDTPAGAVLDWSCTYPDGVPAGLGYELTVTDLGGRREVVATWRSDGTRRSPDLSTTSATPLDEIVRVELVAVRSGRILAAADRDSRRDDS